MVAIVIVNYKTWLETIKCIDSVLSHCLIPFHIYVVDNDSPNDSYKKLKEKYEYSKIISVIQAAKNGGYSYGLNVGYRQAYLDGCNSLIASNNDIIYLDKSIENMIGLLQSNKKIAVVGAQLINNNGERLPSAGDRQSFTKRILQSTFLWKIFKVFIKVNTYYDAKESMEVFYVNGGCFAIRMSVLKALNGFDDNVFLYCEERILGTKISELGLIEYVNPLAEVVHDHSVTVKQGSSFSFINYCYSDLYFCKNYLKINKLQIWILKSVRILVYILKCVNNKDFRKDFVIFLKNYYKL